jgi:membrane protease YdiL (CAAX protease family)
MKAITKSHKIQTGLEAFLPLILILLISWPFKLHFGSWFKADWHVLFYSRFIFWSVVILLLVYTQVRRQPFLPWKEEAKSIRFYIVSIIVLYLLVIVASILSSLPTLLGWHQDNTRLMEIMIKLMNHSTWLLIFGCITAGVTEELLFRGFMLPRLQSALNSKVAAIIISTLSFAALHYQYQSWREIVGPFFIGLIFAVHYQKYRNIKTVIIVHILVDLIAFIAGGYRLRHM